MFTYVLSFSIQDDKSGRSPLIHAVEKGCMEMINFLVEVWFCFFVCFLFYLLSVFSVVFPQKLMTQILAWHFTVTFQ